MASTIQPRRLPERRCSGCGIHRPKKDLIRVLRTPEGEIVIDGTGKKSGRGAYLCQDPACLKKARRAGRLEASLACAIPEEVYRTLEEELTLDTN